MSHLKCESILLKCNSTKCKILAKLKLCRLALSDRSDRRFILNETLTVLTGGMPHDSFKEGFSLARQPNWWFRFIFGIFSSVLDDTSFS